MNNQTNPLKPEQGNNPERDSDYQQANHHESPNIPDINSNPTSSVNAEIFFHPSIGTTRFPDGYFSTSSDSPTARPKKPILKYLVLAFCGLLIIFMIGLLLDKGLRGSWLNDTFSRYTIHTDQESFSLTFYQNSSIQDYKLGSTQEVVITSPTIKGLEEPIIMMFEVTKIIPTMDTMQEAANNGSCNYVFGSAKSFSINVPNLQTKAIFCSLLGLDYYSYFGTNRAEYFVQFQVRLPSQYSSLQSLEVSRSTSSILNNKLDTNDLKLIVESIKPEN